MCNCKNEEFMIDDNQLCVWDHETQEFVYSSIQCHRFCPICGENLQPERSKREDSCNNGHDWMHIPLSDVVDCRRCGALNTMET